MCRALKAIKLSSTGASSDGNDKDSSIKSSPIVYSVTHPKRTLLLANIDVPMSFIAVLNHPAVLLHYHVWSRRRVLFCVPLRCPNSQRKSREVCLTKTNDSIHRMVIAWISIRRGISISFIQGHTTSSPQVPLWRIGDKKENSDGMFCVMVSCW
jgi:hypothetical protein